MAERIIDPEWDIPAEILENTDITKSTEDRWLELNKKLEASTGHKAKDTKENLQAWKKKHTCVKHLENDKTYIHMWNANINNNVGVYNPNRRAKSAKEEAKLPTHTPMKGGKPACPKYNGIYTTGNYRRFLDVNMYQAVPVVQPIRCNSFNCEACGKESARKWYGTTTAAFERLERDRDDLEFGMLTLTLRTKPAIIKTWKRYIAIFDIPDEAIELAETAIKQCEPTPEAIHRACNVYIREMRRRQRNPKYNGQYKRTETWPGPIFRWKLEEISARLYSKYLGRLRFELWRCLKQEYVDGVDGLFYRGVIEFTKQGMPHMHMVMAMRKGKVTHHQIQTEWRRITLDSDQTDWKPVGRENTVGSVTGYAAKYLTKDLDKFGTDKWKGVRRTFKSNSLMLPVKGNDITLSYIDHHTGHSGIPEKLFQFNMVAYRQARARAYYYRKKAERKREEAVMTGIKLDRPNPKNLLPIKLSNGKTIMMDKASKEYETNLIWQKLRDEQMRQRPLLWEVCVDKSRKKVIEWEVTKYFWETEGKHPRLQWVDGIEHDVTPIQNIM